MPDISVDEIFAKSKKALIAHGARPDIASHVAHAVAEAEAYGNIICGLYYLESYCLQLLSGRVKGDVDPVVTTPRPGSVRSDAGFGFAQPAFAAALTPTMRAAKENGIASLSVANAHTCTSLGYFTSQFADAGYIALGMTNASPIVAAPGGKKRILGTNPIAFSVPGDGNMAMHFDFSTSAVALGKITMAKAAGESIPEGWAVDAGGNPTTDPNAALSGALLSAGGYKGWGFGLMGEVMVAAFSASANSRDLKPLKAPEGDPHGIGQTYLVIDPETHNSDFQSQMQALIEAVGEDDGARIPGQNRVKMDVVAVPDALWALVNQLISHSA